MRIYLAFFQTADRGGAAANYGFWAETLRAGLHEAGHVVLESPGLAWAEGMADADPAVRRAWRERTWTRALADLARFQAEDGVDLFLSYLFPEQIEPDAIRELERRGIPAVNFFCDNVREFRRVPAEYRPFQLHWVPEWAALPLYRSAGLRCVHAPMPAWIPPALRVPAEREELGATFLGSWDELRADLFGRLAQLGGRLRIHGRDWGAPVAVSRAAPARHQPWLLRQSDFVRQHGVAAWLRKFSRQRATRLAPPADWLGEPVTREEYLRLTRESTVTVGVNRYESPRLRAGEIATYSRLRDIEAPMLGACYLTEWAPGLDQLYDLEREIAVYRDEAGLAGQLRELLADGPRRARMRQAAQSRALREHAIGPTVDRIAAALGLATQPAAAR